MLGNHFQVNKIKIQLLNHFFFSKDRNFCRYETTTRLFNASSFGEDAVRERQNLRQDACQMSRFISNNKPARADTRDVWALYNVQHNMIQLCAEQCRIWRARQTFRFVRRDKLDLMGRCVLFDGKIWNREMRWQNYASAN